MGKISKQDQDKLREIGSIGANHSATALSKLLGQKIAIKVSKANILTMDEVSSRISGPEKIVVGVVLPVQKKDKKIVGNLLVVFPKESAFAFSDIIQKKKPGSTKVLSEIDKDSLKEVTNIVTGNYLTAINKFTGLTQMYGVPRLFTTFGKSIIDFIFLESKKRVRDILLIETEFKMSPLKIEGKFIFLTEIESVEELLRFKGPEELSREKSGRKD